MIYFVSIADTVTRANVGIVIVEAHNEPTAITKSINIGIKAKGLTKIGIYNILSTECLLEELKEHNLEVDTFYTIEQILAKDYTIKKACSEHGYNVSMTAFRNYE